MTTCSPFEWHAAQISCFCPDTGLPLLQNMPMRICSIALPEHRGQRTSSVGSDARKRRLVRSSGVSGACEPSITVKGVFLGTRYSRPAFRKASRSRLRSASMVSVWPLLSTNLSTSSPPRLNSAPRVGPSRSSCTSASWPFSHSL